MAGRRRVLLLAQAVVLALWPDAHLLMIDLQVYRAGGEHLLAGTSLYDGGVLLDLPFVYPPFAAVVFVPLTVLPLPVLKLAWTAAGVALVVFVVRRSAALIGMRADPAVVALLVAVLLALDPIRTTFYLGQINVVLLAVVLADVTGRPGRWRGVGIGLAAAVKLTPLVFVVYLMLTGRMRAAVTALATFAAAVGVGFLVAPADSVTYWLEGTFAAADRISPVASTANHSLAGLLARAGAPEWIGLAATAVVGVGGAGRRRARPSPGRDAARGDGVRAAVGGGRAVRVVAPLRVVRPARGAAGAPRVRCSRSRGRPAGGRRAGRGRGRHAGVRDPPARAGGRPDPEYRVDLAAARRLPGAVIVTVAVAARSLITRAPAS